MKRNVYRSPLKIESKRNGETRFSAGISNHSLSEREIFLKRREATVNEESLWNMALRCKAFQSNVKIYDRLLFSKPRLPSREKQIFHFKLRVRVLIDASLSQNKKETDCWKLIKCSECENREKFKLRGRRRRNRPTWYRHRLGDSMKIVAWKTFEADRHFCFVKSH